MPKQQRPVGIPDQSLPVDDGDPFEEQDLPHFEDPKLEDLDEDAVRGSTALNQAIPELELAAKADPKAFSSLVHIIKTVINSVAPGLVEMGKRFAPKPEPKPFAYAEGFAKYMKANKETRLVGLGLRPHGELGGQYHGKLFHINKPGFYKDAVPEVVAVKLSEDHPKDFFYKV